MNNSTETPSARGGFISILKTDNTLKAVELQKYNGNFTILWSKSTKENDLDWQTFAENCGLHTKTTLHEHVQSDKNVVVGYDSTGTAFYRVNVPMVEEKEVSSIVQLQAESRFPLSADQMELAWRTSKLPNKQMAITIAAARKQNVHKFIDEIRFLNPVKAILDYEAVVKVWLEVFTGQNKNAVIVNAGTHNTQICLAEKGLLCTAVTLDIGTVDFGDNDSQEDNKTLERLVRDIRSVVDLFGMEKQFEMPVIVLSDGSEIYENLSACLQLVGLNASSAKPSLRKLSSDNKLDLKEIFEYRAAIGLALMAHDSNNDELNLFKYLFEHLDKEEKKHWYYSPKITCSIAAVLLLLFVMVSYAEIAGGSRVINNRLSNLGSETEINDLVEKQKLFKEIAKQRADLLALLKQVTQSGQGISYSQNNPRLSTNEQPNQKPKTPPKSGIQLDSFHFKKGSQVAIAGKAQKNENLEDFEKCLMSYKNDITDIQLSIKSSNGSSNRNTPTKTNDKNSPPKPPGNPGGSGDKGFAFTITFNYKDFSTSQRRR
ncbi:MAG: hypothetical protein JXA96_00675 [Sedimentisphaerales bacterium]|nr:hypothetical protein [Sedimentisphaerales bacterium]